MTIGRPLEFDPDVALEAATQLFWSKGYESSSLQDLLSTMGISKSSFYQTFKSKHLLFQSCIQNYRKMLIDSLRAQLKEARSGRIFIRTIFDGVANETIGICARRGCLLMNTASEFSQTDPEISELVSISLENLTDIFETAIKQAQEQGEIPPSKDPRSLATYLVSSMSGLKNMVKAGADRETIKRIASIIQTPLE
ncbi:MAG: TetR/AcrR family transcriptional regulator [Kiritimatiellales bacterium]|nr:TetR/AcrR family transcriptional regulator [Kiritimatiellales bacterium]